MQSLSSFRKLSSTKSMGIEWEMCLPLDLQDEMAYNYHGFFYSTTDASIDVNDYNFRGAELVSQPLTAPWLLKELERLNKKKLIGMTWNASCGIHIHVNKDWCNETKGRAIWQFLGQLDGIQYFDAFGRPESRYAFRIHPDDLYGAGGRYKSLNITNAATIEFRMFRSGDLKWAQYCVKLVEYMVTNAKHLNQDAFFAFVDANKPV